MKPLQVPDSSSMTSARAMVLLPVWLVVLPEGDPERAGAVAVLDNVHVAASAEEGAGAAGHDEVLVRGCAANAGGGDVAVMQVNCHAEEDLGAGVADPGDQTAAGLRTYGSTVAVGEHVPEGGVVPGVVVPFMLL